MAGDTRLKGMLTEGREAVTILLGFGVFFGGILASPVPNAAKLPATAACAVFFLMFAVYLYKLRGADEPPGSPARREFDLFHENLELGFGFNDWYARSLTRVLDSLDRFFRDADKEEVAKLARFAAAPPKVAQCWSAPAYDKCLALALLYPLATMFLVWVATGHAGDAERAVGLDGSPAGAFAWRLGVPASVAILVFAWFKFQRKPDWKKALVLFTGGVGSGFSMMFFAGFGLGAVAGSFICVVISTVFFFDLLAVAGAVALIFGFGVSAVVAVAREFSFARAIHRLVHKPACPLTGLG